VLKTNGGGSLTIQGGYVVGCSGCCSG